MKKMRAAVLTGPRRLEIVEVETPQPAPGEIQIRIEGTGVCASNLASWEGMPWTTYPSRPGSLGHEAWGTVDEIGAGVTRFKPGDRVAALSSRAYAEYDLAPEDSAIAIPDALAQSPMPLEALGCAMNIFRRAQIEAGQTVAIVGIGFLGALLTELASKAGARVIAISRRKFALDLAKSRGARETIEMLDHHQIISRVGELTSGTFCERVIEAVGKQWPLDLSAELAAEGSRLVIAGYHQDGPRQVNMQLWNWRGFDVINAHERDRDVCMAGMRAALDAQASGRIDPTALYTHRFRLEALAQAFETLEQRPDGFVKALVRL